MNLAGGGVTDHDTLKIRKNVKFQRLDPATANCAGEVSVVIVIEKYYNLVSSSKRNTMVKTKKIIKCLIIIVF